MRRIVDNDYLTLIFRLAVGVTFIYASLYKIADPASFAKSIWYYHIFPGNMINLTALVVPWVEMSCGVFLITGVLYRGSVLIVNVMVLFFIILLTSAIVRGISIDCGCFKASTASNRSAYEALFFDIGLLIGCLQLLFSRSRRWLLSRSVEQKTVGLGQPAASHQE